MTKDFLGGLTVDWPHLVLGSSSINRVGLNNGTFGNLLRAPSTEELGTWTGHFTGTSHSYSNYFFTIINHIQACVSLPFVIAIGSLQFNKTLHSVTCINCKLYTCRNSSISLRNDSLLILRSRRNLWFPVNLQRPWEEGLMAGLASRLLTKLLQRSKRFVGWLILGILGLIAICTTAMSPVLLYIPRFKHIILSKIGLKMLIIYELLRLR